MAEKEKGAGDNVDQAQKDRGGFKTDVENVTGGTQKGVEEGGTQEVGNPYDNDPLGEERGGK